MPVFVRIVDRVRVDEESDGNDRSRMFVGRVVRCETRVFKVVARIPPVTRFRDEEGTRIPCHGVPLAANFVVEFEPVS